MISSTFNRDSMHQATINKLTYSYTDDQGKVHTIGNIIKIINDLCDEIKKECDKGNNNITGDAIYNCQKIDADGNPYWINPITNEETIEVQYDSSGSPETNSLIVVNFNVEHIINYFKGLGYTIIDNRESIILSEGNQLENWDFVSQSNYPVKTGTFIIAW